MAVLVYNPGDDFIVHKTKADFVIRSAQPIVHIVQYDNVLPIIEVALFQNGEKFHIPTSATIMVKWKKPDGTFVYNSVLGCNESRDAVYIQVIGQMTTTPGTIYPDIELSYSAGPEATVSAQTAAFPVVIEKSPIQDSDVASGDYSNIFEQVSDAINEATNAADTATQVADETREMLESIELDTSLPDFDITSIGVVKYANDPEFQLPYENADIDSNYITDLTVTIRFKVLDIDVSQENREVLVKGLRNLKVDDEIAFYIAGKINGRCTRQRWRPIGYIPITQNDLNAIKKNGTLCISTRVLSTKGEEQGKQRSLFEALNCYHTADARFGRWIFYRQTLGVRIRNKVDTKFSKMAHVRIAAHKESGDFTACSFVWAEAD